MPKKVLTIAGSDPIAGGGLQADLATFSEYGLFGLATVTSIVTLPAWQFKLYPLDLAVIDEELATVFALPELAGVKLGLLPDVATIELVGQYLKRYPELPVVCDPVLIFKETDDVDLAPLVAAYQKYVFPFANVITPNLAEAAVLTGLPLAETNADVERQAQTLRGQGPAAVIIKGGARLAGEAATDFLLDRNGGQFFTAPKVAGVANNGAGCTFSAAVLANLVHGQDLSTSVERAKEFVHAAIEHNVQVNDEFGNVWPGAERLGRDN